MAYRILEPAKMFSQKCYLLWTIRNIMDAINGSRIMKFLSVMDTFEAQFIKKISFRQMYDLFKRKKQYFFYRKIPNGLASAKYETIFFFWQTV